MGWSFRLEELATHPARLLFKITIWKFDEAPPFKKETHKDWLRIVSVRCSLSSQCFYPTITHRGSLLRTMSSLCHGRRFPVLQPDSSVVVQAPKPVH